MSRWAGAYRAGSMGALMCASGPENPEKGENPQPPASTAGFSGFSENGAPKTPHKSTSTINELNATNGFSGFSPFSGRGAENSSAPWHPADADDAAERDAIAADAATLLPDPGTPERRHLDHEQTQAVAGLLEAARKRPTSWADPTSLPATGTYCACCQGTQWWGDARGWRCATCHPLPDGYRSEGNVRRTVTHHQERTAS